MHNVNEKHAVESLLILGEEDANGLLMWGQSDSKRCKTIAQSNQTITQSNRAIKPRFRMSNAFRSTRVGTQSTHSSLETKSQLKPRESSSCRTRLRKPLEEVCLSSKNQCLTEPSVPEPRMSCLINPNSHANATFMIKPKTISFQSELDPISVIKEPPFTFKRKGENILISRTLNILRQIYEDAARVQPRRTRTRVMRPVDKRQPYLLLKRQL